MNLWEKDIFVNFSIALSLKLDAVSKAPSKELKLAARFLLMLK